MRLRKRVIRPLHAARRALRLFVNPQPTEQPMYLRVKELMTRWNVPKGRIHYLIKTNELAARDMRRPGSKRARYEIAMTEVKRFEAKYGVTVALKPLNNAE
jgi:hypothetical protein